ncbi:hypothetical protein B6J68_28830 [Klebsiella quasipneumoniae]|uniref:glycosyltransferase family 2 protein n=1 Tax=Klebsiella quasipneumoniae TaxID=1463165 RepID=UPI000C7CF3FC|nr:glycosyltransferase family 2 protein [Klebsiella quasipneumoniae]PLJ54693.1 hypothetical protein B6J68_28830 [Klebsiella quasipneumoniae]
MKLSIVIPCYNCADKISRLLDRIYVQIIKYDEAVEVILINDGSTDGTYNSIQTYLQRNGCDKFTLVDIQNCGAAGARHKGLELAVGEYVFFCDSDDLISPNFVQIILNKCESEPDVIYFSSEIISSGEEYHKIADKVLFDNDGFFTSANDFLSHQLKRGYWTAAVWTYVFKRSIAVLHHANFTNRVAHEDHLFSANIILNSNNIIFIKQTLYFQIKTRGSLTNSTKNLEYIHERYLAFLEVRGYLRRKCKKDTILLYEIWSLRSMYSLFMEDKWLLFKAFFSFSFWKGLCSERELIIYFFLSKIKKRQGGMNKHD